MNLPMAFLTFSGLMLTAVGVHAQDAGQDMLQYIKPEDNDRQAKIDANEKLLRTAEVLLKTGKPDEAYKLLEPLEFERSGEVRFDYLIGIAALDSGKPDKATLAFERVLTEEPDYAGARLDLARAYYQLGDKGRAKTEFETVMNQYPSEAARATIQKYLDEIAAQEMGKETHISYYVEGTMGRDTNVNNASEAADHIAIPIVNPNSKELADNYFGFAAGGEIIHGLDANFRLYAGADLNQHNNYRQKSFDISTLEERLGMIYSMGTDRYRLGLSAGQNTLGNSRYRNSSSLNAEWRHTVAINNQLNIFGQYMQYRYADLALQLNDVNQQIVGVGWLHVLSDTKSTLSGSFYYGAEQDVGPVTLANLEGGRTDGARRIGGFHVGGQVAIGEGVKLFFNAVEQFSRFNKVNAAISEQRTDQLNDYTLGATWYPSKLWSARMQLTRFINMSNVDAYAYDRTDYSLTIRRNFK